jgi:lipopolysaccharide/colanic/teichoic acid biosynthesis glycosyltransferase
MIRFFDILISVSGLLIFSPVFAILSIWIKIDSKGPVFFKQKRVGKNSSDFVLLKLRSMYLDSDRDISITIGNRDPRITRSGYFIRKFKLDELPQLINVFIGDMSLVGPRPEVRKYVEYYTEEQKFILSFKPGITDYASIKFANENELLAKSSNPEKLYINEILPTKIELNKIYLNSPTLKNYFNIIFLTLKCVLK